MEEWNWEEKCRLVQGKARNDWEEGGSTNREGNPGQGVIVNLLLLGVGRVPTSPMLFVPCLRDHRMRGRNSPFLVLFNSLQCGCGEWLPAYAERRLGAGSCRIWANVMMFEKLQGGKLAPVGSKLSFSISSCERISTCMSSWDSGWEM